MTEVSVMIVFIFLLGWIGYRYSVLSNALLNKVAKQMRVNIMIKPTVGRVVWYWPKQADRIAIVPGQPLSAQIAAVNEDGTVNLGVLDASGNPYSAQGVYLCEADQLCEPGQCEWMPYQKGQAAKTEALESELDGGSADLKESGIPSVESIAESCHIVNQNYCLEVGIERPIDWADLPEDVRLSVMSGVEIVLEETGVTPEYMHEMWMLAKLESGWAMTIAVDDPVDYENKLHPNLRPFNELPEEQQVKDLLFINTVRGCIGLDPIEGVINKTDGGGSSSEEMPQAEDSQQEENAA